MKGRYTGRTMSVYGAILPGAARLARLTPDLSKQGRGRLKWFDYYERHNHNASLTARYFGISRQTFYRWKRRYNPRNLSTLEARAHRPRRLRQPTWSSELATAVQRVREANPPLGKGQARAIAPSGRMGGLHFDGRADTGQAAGTRGAARALGEHHFCPKAALATALWRAQAERVSAGCTGRSGAGGHARCAANPRRGAQTVHRAGCREPLGCPGDLQSGYRDDRHSLFGCPPSPLSFRYT